MKRIILAGLLGGIAMFIWEHIAYTALPLGITGFRKLPNETAMLAVLQNNLAENSGIYLFPGLWLEPNPPDKKAETTNGFAEKVARYPSGILMYNAAGARSINLSRWLSVEFLTELAEAVLAVFLLSRTRLTTFGARLGFILLIGVVAAIATNISYWNWYGFPWSYTLAYMFIEVVGFLCVGLVAALVLKKQTFGVASARWFLPGISPAIPGG
jgi:hypothetical protein